MVWNCCPEMYGKFQSEIPSTSGAICEKPQGGPLPPPPPAGRGLMVRTPSIEVLGVALRLRRYSGSIISILKKNAHKPRLSQVCATVIG